MSLKKKYISIVVSALAVIGGAFAVVPHVKAQQSSTTESIIGFSSNLEPHTDGSMHVTEKIIYDFGTLNRHGIYRTIRDKNADGEKIDVAVDSVVDENGKAYNYTTTRGSENVVVKIGDANVTITGVHTYIISYDVTNVATYFKDHDEFTWNAIGTEWGVPVKNASATLHVPTDGVYINPQNIGERITFSCYTGPYGSTTACENKVLVDDTVIFIQKDMSAGSDLTISVGVPSGLITKPKQPFDYTIFAWILPLFIFVQLISKAIKKRRDLKPGKTIIPEYESPTNMMPTLVGSVVDGSVDNRDVTSGLISAAEQGFVKITRKEKTWFLGSTDYEITLLRPTVALSQVAEQKIVEAFMEGKAVGESSLMSSIDKRSFASEISKLKKALYAEMVSRGYFTKDPANRKIIHWISGVMMFFLSFAFGIALQSINVGGALIATFLLTILWPYIVSVRTIAGADTRRHILGFKQFLSVTDKDRLEFHNAPEKNPETFMKYLPYAIALGVEDKWAKQFEGMYITPPSWYDGGSSGSFVAANFARDMALFTAFTSSSARAASSGSGFSSGGGFSGGGGGGGGGGSW